MTCFSGASPLGHGAPWTLTVGIIPNLLSLSSALPVPYPPFLTSHSQPQALCPVAPAWLSRLPRGSALSSPLSSFLLSLSLSVLMQCLFIPPLPPIGQDGRADCSRRGLV